MPTGMRKRKKITDREFEKRFTKVVSKRFATLPREEQEASLEAAERRLAKISSDTRTRAAQVPETPPIRLSARNRHAER